MIKVMISGCNGRMGQVVANIVEDNNDIKAVAGADICENPNSPFPVFTDLNTCDQDIDVIIDFSNPAALNNISDFAKKNNLPLVIATTGFSQEQVKFIEETAKVIPVFFSPNLSLGVNLLIDLARKAVKVLEDNFDIEIIEKHHSHKIDAPSGTALIIADEINKELSNEKEYIYDRHSRRKKRSQNEIGIHAIRCGTIVGEHSIIFAGNDEIIELTHKSMSKDIFAVGAVKAAKYMIGKKPGLYQMKDLIKNS